MRVKTANSAPKIAKLKTKAVTKVAVDAVFAALMLDLQTSQPLEKQKGGKGTYMVDSRKGATRSERMCVYTY